MEPPPVPRPPPTRTILVVDSDPATADDIARQLGPTGCAVQSASDGRTALEVLARDATDLVVLELGLPDMSGLELLKAIRARRSAAELPIIVQTDSDRRSAMFEAFRLGASDYVTKPVDLDVVAARIGAHMRVRETARVDPVTAHDPAQPRAPLPLARGSIVGQRYQIEERIGSGTFGVVYRARHLDLEDEVAIKVMHPEHASRPESRVRFHREAVAAWTLRHPNAVAVLDFGIDSDGLAFLVMELLDGEGLDDLLRREGRLSIERSLAIVVPVCAALEAAHAAGIVHRDVKPSNILLSVRRGQETVKLLDFGIAESTTESRKLTLEGWVGTPTYMAPERFLGEPCEVRSDVYSLGVILYEMLAGRPPFQVEEHDPIALALLHLREQPVPLQQLRSGLPHAVEQAVGWAMSKRPQHRPTTAELHNLLREALPT